MITLSSKSKNRLKVLKKLIKEGSNGSKVYQKMPKDIQSGMPAITEEKKRAL